MKELTVMTDSSLTTAPGGAMLRHAIWAACLPDIHPLSSMHSTLQKQLETPRQASGLGMAARPSHMPFGVGKTSSLP